MPTIKSSADLDLLDEAEKQIHSLAFYTISEEENRMIVVRFLFQKSNWNAILRQGFSLV
jgi:hypothetical protein